jgi:hypothetical protein
MGRLALAVLACMVIVLTICAPAQAQPATPVPPTIGAVVLVEPGVRLSRMTFLGATQARDDWSAAATRHLAEQTQAKLSGRGREIIFVARADLGDQGRQILLLHDAVRVSMRLEDRELARATIPRGRDWTLGAGARALGGNSAATHALLIVADGEFTGLGRAVYLIGSAAAGVPAESGLQRASAMLVALDSGAVVWRNERAAPPDADMRTPGGARRLVDLLLQDAPL